MGSVLWSCSACAPGAGTDSYSAGMELTTRDVVRPACLEMTAVQELLY